MKVPRFRGAAIFFAVIALSSLVGQPVCAAEPEFQGKPAAVWLDALTSHDDAKREAAVKAIAADPQGAKSVLDEFVRQLNTRDILYRLRLRQALASAGRAAFPSLLHGLQSADATILNQSFSALRFSRVSASELAAGLLRLLPKVNPTVERKVYFALQDMGSDAVPALVDAANDRDPINLRVREMAFGLLCNLGPKTSPMVAVVLGRLDDKSPKVRRQAVDALRAIPAADEPGASLALRNVAINDPDAQVRVAARVSLGTMRKYSGPHAAALENKVLRILGDLHDRDPATVRRAISEVGMLGSPAKETKGALSPLLFDPDFANRSLAAAALVLVSGNTDSLEVIKDGLRENEPLSGQVIELLVRIGLPAVPVLLEAEQHAKDESVQKDLACSVRRIAIGKEDKEALRNLLTADSSRVQGWAAEKLLEIGDPSPKTIATLAKRMKDADRQVREKAAVRMMDLGQVAVPLIDVAQEKDPLVRRKAIYLMTVIGQPSDAAVDAFVRALDDEDETVRFWACVALGRVKDQQMRLAPLLTACQTDSSEKVRTAARNAFQQLTLSEM